MAGKTDGIGNRIKALAGGVLLLGTLLIPISPVAQAAKTFTFDLPAQSLAAALRQFSIITRHQIVAPSNDLRHLSSEALQGRYTAEAALKALITTSGLSITAYSDDTYTLAYSGMPGTTGLPPRPALEEMTVLGTKQNLSLQETQTSVELFSQQRIEQEVLFSLDDILLRTANVSADNVQSGFSIRGIGQGGVGFAGTGQTANVYVDGMPLSSNAQQGVQSLWDVGQVEVLRGPQSTVQGRNALAGAIIINTKDPTYDWEFGGRIQAATEDVTKVSGVVSGPLVDNQLAFRLAYDYQTYDGDLVEATTGIAQEFQDSYAWRAKLLAEPEAVPGLRMELIAERVETDFGEFNTVFAPVPFDDPAFADFDPYGGETHTRVRLEKPETDKFIADLTYDLNDHWTLVAIGTYEDNNRPLQFGVPVDSEVLLSSSPTADQTVSLEFRAAFDYGRIAGWFGAYHFDSDRKQNFRFTLNAADFGLPLNHPDTLLSVITTGEISTENQAVFGDITFDLGDSWSLNLGGRYDKEEFSDSGNRGRVIAEPADCTATLPDGAALPCTSLFPVNSTPGAPASFEALLPRGSLTYRFDQDRSVSLAVQRGYRAGGAVVRSVPEAAILEVVEFDPEYVTNYELALRSQWLDRRLTVNANLFYTDWTDQQVSIPGASGSAAGTDAVVDNVGSSKLYGLELSVVARPADNLDIFASLGLLRTEFTDFPFANSPPAPANAFENLAGNAFTAAPEATASLGMSYEHDSGFYGSWTASYRDSQQSDVTNLAANEVGSYTLVNGRFGYRFDNATVYVFANNLFDERFATRKEFIAVNASTGAVITRPNARFQINEPRIAGLAIEFSY